MRRVRVRIDRSAVRLWHARLIERIDALPAHRATIELCDGPGPPPNAELLFSLESLINGLARPGLATRIDPRDIPVRDDGHTPPDLTIDLGGGATPGTSTPGASIWDLSFEEGIGEAGLLASLLAGRAPVASLRSEGGVVATGRLGTERPGVALAAFEDGLARVTTLILAALCGAASASLPGGVTEDKRRDGLASSSLAKTGLRATRSLARRITRRLDRLCYQSPHWRVGWRHLQGGPDLWALRRHPDGGWTDLPDDGLRFYADPFPILHDGKVTLFIEEYDHARQKGIISAVAFDDSGPVGRPVPVLDLPCHLSYPFVLDHDGEVWMIPESCAAGSIDLYRATAFPGGWVHEATLVDGVTASDATIVRYGDLWWMFATVQDHGGSYSDALCLWSAPDVKGPWIAHDRNPVLIDAASARPAGRIVERDGVLMRPVQDCRVEYGHALGLARILRLDQGGFEQVVETTLHAGPKWPGHLLHTLNAAGGFEFIDGSARARRPLFPRARSSGA